MRHTGFTTRVARPHQPEGSSGYGHDQGFYYTSGMGASHGPQVGPSASARFKYDNLLTRGLSDLTARVNAMELRQEEIGHNLDHNTSLTQESWGCYPPCHTIGIMVRITPHHIQTSSPELR